MSINERITTLETEPDYNMENAHSLRLKSPKLSTNESLTSNITSLTGSNTENNNTQLFIINPNTGKKLNLEEAIKENIYDPVENMIRSATNNNSYSWEESVKMGLIVNESNNEPADEKIIQRNCVVHNYYYVHKGVGVTAKLTNQMLTENQIDPINQLINDPKTGKSTTLINGLENGSVFATIITLTNKSLYFENLNKRHDNYQIISVYDPRINQLITYQEAIDKQVINIIDSTYINHKTNEISTLSEALQHGLLHAIMKTRQYMPLSCPFTNVHIRTIEEEMNFSIPQSLPENVLRVFSQKPNENINFEELIITSTSMDHEIPIKTDNNKNQIEINQGDAPNVAKKYIEMVKSETEKLSTIEQKLLKEVKVFLNEKENQLLLDEFQDINSEFASQQTSVLTLIHEIERFLMKKYDTIPLEIEKELEVSTNLLKTHTNQTQKELNNRSRLLIAIIDEFDQFINRLNDCNSAHDKLKLTIDKISNVKSVENLQKSLTDLKLLDNEFASYNNDIRVLIGSKIKFTDKINKLEEHRKKFSDFVKEPFVSNQDSKTDQEITELLNEVTDGQKDLQELYKTKLSQIKDVLENLENLMEKQKKIDEICENSREELEKILSNKEQLSIHLLLPYTDNLHRLNGEMASTSKIIKDIEDCLHDSIKSLEVIGNTKENIDLFRKSIDDSLNNFEEINKRLQDILQQINEQEISNDDTVYSINNLDHWLKEIDQRIKNIGSLSLDPKYINEQERLIQTILAEISSRQPFLENVLMNNATKNEPKLKELEDKIKQKLLIASNIEAKVNDTRKLLNSFEVAVKSCGDWIALTTELLSDRMFVRLDNEKFQEKLDEIKEGYDMKQRDMEQVRKICKDLISQPNCKDQNSIEMCMENLEKVWSSLNELINTRLKELSDRKNYSEKYSQLKAKIIENLNNWEQTLSMNIPLAIDLLTLQNQHEDTEYFINEWNSCNPAINAFYKVGSEYDSIMQGFPLGGEQQAKLTSPQRRPSKIKSELYVQPLSSTSITKPATGNSQSGHYSGSESSGVSSADYVNLNQEFSETILEINDIKSRYSEIGDQLINRKSDIAALLNKCLSFDKEYKEFSDKLDSELNELLGVEVKILILNDEIIEIERIDEDIRNLRPTLMNILTMGQDLLRHRELVPGGVELKSKLDRLEKKFISLKDSAKKHLNLRRNTDSQMKKFNEMKKSIENNIVRKERMLNVLGPVGTSVSYGNAQLQQVNALIDEVDGLENDVKELRDIGEEIIRSMSPTSSEVDDIEETLERLSKKVDNLNKLLKDREINIHAIMGPSKDFYKFINSVSDRLALLQEKIDKNDANVMTSFDWEEVQTELDSIKSILQESENLSKTLLESISDENTHYEIKNKVSNLSRHCREIQWKIDHSVNMIGKRSQHEDVILTKLEDTEQWLQRKQEQINLLSLDVMEIPTTLSDNIRQLQILQGDIKHKKSQVEDVYTELNRMNEEKSPTHKSKQIFDKLAVLTNVIENIDSDINNLSIAYQQASTDLNKINNETNKIEAWIDIEKHKMNKHYPVGLESIDSEIKQLKSTEKSIENKHQQINDLKTLITPSHTIDSKILLSKNLSSIFKVESDLRDLQFEADERLEFLKKLQEQISTTTENMNYLKSALLKLETKAEEYSKFDESADKQPIDVSKLESEIKTIQSDMHLIKPDIENNKLLIASIAQISPVNATLLEPEMEKIVNRCQVLSSSLAQKLIYLNSKHKAMDECKSRIEIFATRQRNLKEKIDNFPQSSLDLDSLEDQIQDLANLRRESNEIEKSLSSLKSEVNSLAEHKIETAEKSQHKIDNLAANNEQIIESIDDRQNSLILQHKIVTEFESKKNDFIRKIEEANNDPELAKLLNNTSKNIAAFSEQKVKPLKKQLEEVIDIGNKACSTVVSGLGFKHMEQEMDSVKHSFDRLMQIVSDIENHVDIKLMKEQKFDTSLKNLKEFVENISRDLDAEEEPSIEYHKSKSQLNSHRLLLDRLKKRQSSLDELSKAGSDLLVNTKESKKSQLQNELDELNVKYENLLNLAEGKNCRYDRAVKLSKSFKDFYEPSLIWLDTAEKNLANFDTSPTVDANEMEKRIQEYKSLVKEIKSHEETLKNLDQVGEDLRKISSENDSAAINSKINILHNYFDEISVSALKKLSLFENSIPIAERFLLANNKLDLVLPSLTALVRENDSLTGQVGERNMEILENETNSVEKLVCQARNDLDKLKSVDAFENSLEKVEDIFVENEKRFKEVLNEVTKKATKIGSNRTKAKIQEENLDQCLEVLSNFEQKINEMNDQINNDYSELEECKIEFTNLLSDWNEQKESINSTINDSKKLIRQAPGSDLKSLKSAVDRVKKQSESTTKTLESQQQKLDEAIPLAKEYINSYNKLRDWLIETEENMYQNKINNLDPDQLHKAEQEIKALANSWEDQKPLLDIIIKSGHPLSQIVNRVQGKNIMANIDDAKKRYNNIKEFIKTRATDLEDLISINTELNEKVDQCANQLENIRDRITDSYQPSVHPEKLDEELGVFDEILYDLDKLQIFVDKLQVGIESCSPSRKNAHDKEDSVEILEKLAKISSSNKDLQTQTLEYKEKIMHLLLLANEFWNDLKNIEEKFQEMTIHLTNSTIEDLNTRSVKDKKKQIEDLRGEIDVHEKDIGKISQKGKELVEKVNNPNETPDVEQAEEELKRNFDAVRSSCEQQIVNIDRQQSLITKLEEMRIKLDEWFKEQNNRLFILGPLPTETRPVLTQIQKTKELKNEIEPKHRDIELINQLGYQLTKGSHPNIKNQVNSTLARINDSWARLLDGLGQRQHQLQCILLSLGEFHRAVDEFIEWIIATENSLSNIKIENGDINSLEMGLAQHKMIRADMNISQASVSKIERKAAEIIKEDVSSLGHEATQRLEQLRKSWESLKDHARAKHIELEDALKEALIFYGDQQEISKNIDELGSKLDVFKFSGGLPDTAKEQLKRFMDIYRTFPKLNIKIEKFIEESTEISKKSPPSIGKAIEIDMDILVKKWETVKNLAETRKSRLEKAIETVETFHLDMGKFINWLTLTEKNLNQQRPVSRIISTILEQVEAHRALKRDITSHREEMLNLDKMATHLKYISQKHDIVLIRNLMSSIHHRWEKVVSRSSERSRNLDYGYKEAKRFEDMNKTLLDDIASNLEILERDTSIGQTPSKIREQIAKHKEFHCNLGVHNLTYDATRRLGYQLRDKAPIQDSKKIDEIVHNLQMKWQNLCNKSIEREKALNDALLLSGNYKDAMTNLLSWLRAIEPKLSDSSKRCGGDINTVQTLLNEHSTLEKQLRGRDHMIEKINTDAMTLMIQSEEDSSFIEDQLAELKSTWNNVNKLADEKKKRLKEAKNQAIEFERLWNSLKEFFSKSDHELRQFTISPEEEKEELISNMISNHGIFHNNLLMNEMKINDFQQFGHEILVSAYPEAEGPIKHYINIIKSQWTDLLSWSEQRGLNLRDHLDRLNKRKILLDDLLLWLAAAEGTLLASESRELSYALTEAKFQYDEHERFITDMTLKQKDHDEIITNSKKKTPQQIPTFDKSKRMETNQGISKIQEPFFVNPKINQLHSKWKQVWFMILNRRKRLLDHIEYLKEVENMKHFNFDDWRRRYMSWMNHSKSRVMDFFRRQDTDHDGRVTRKEFIDGIIDSKFQTTRVEMEVVADIFDKQKSGFIDYRQFLAALRPDRETYQVKPANENEIIHDEVKKQISKCTCSNPYKITQCGDGKYKFGDTEKLRLVRILRSNVMVRIGGGWCALDEFLVKHDPCRAKGRTNYELREKLSYTKGTINTMAPFKFKPATLPIPAKKPATAKIPSPRIPQPLSSPRIPKPLASPRISSHIPSSRVSQSLASPRNPKVIASPGLQHKSRIPTRQTSQQGSQSSTRHQSRDVSPESATSTNK